MAFTGGRKPQGSVAWLQRRCYEFRAAGSEFPWGCFDMFQRFPFHSQKKNMAGASHWPNCDPREEAKTGDQLMDEQEQQRQEKQEQQRQEKFSAGLSCGQFAEAWPASCEVTEWRFEWKHH